MKKKLVPYLATCVAAGVICAVRDKIAPQPDNEYPTNPRLVAVVAAALACAYAVPFVHQKVSKRLS